MQPTERITDTIAASRFELAAGGNLATAAYERDGGTIIVTHTIVPPMLRGRGMGGRLIAGALDAARAAHLMVTPRCSFVAAVIDKHPRYADLVIPGSAPAT